MSIQWSKISLFNNWCWENYTGTCKNMKLDHQLIAYNKINSKRIKELNINHDTIKVLLKNIGGKISDISRSNIFTNITPRAREIKGKKWDYITLKCFYMANETIIKRKRESTV